MRHVPAADLQANAAELTAALDAGEEVVVTLEGRDYQLVAAPVDLRPDDPATIEQRRHALADLQLFRDDLRSQGLRVTPSEIREWINEGRR